MEYSGMWVYYTFPERIVVVSGADVPWRRRTIVGSISQRPLTVWLMEFFHSPRAGELVAVEVVRAEVREKNTLG
jgi:hypothetical protein